MNPVALTVINPWKEDQSGWLSGERVELMTWWLQVQDPVEEKFLASVFLPLISAEACEKGQWHWKEIC